MPRTKGAKNKPKDPDRELERVKTLFTARGRAFPGDTTPGTQQGPGAACQGPQRIIFDTGDRQDDNHDNAYTCGACNQKLDGECPVCPYCGARLTWG